MGRCWRWWCAWAQRKWRVEHLNLFDVLHGFTFFHQSNNSIYLAKKGKHIWMFSCPSQAAVAREQAKRLQSPTGPTEGRSSLRRPASLRLIGPVTQLATRMAGADAMLREATNLATSSFRSLAQVDSELLLAIVPMNCVGIQSRWNPMRTV